MKSSIEMALQSSRYLKWLNSVDVKRSPLAQEKIGFFPHVHTQARALTLWCSHVTWEFYKCVVTYDWRTNEIVWLIIIIFSVWRARLRENTHVCPSLSLSCRRWLGDISKDIVKHFARDENENDCVFSLNAFRVTCVHTARWTTHHPIQCLAIRAPTQSP